MYNKGNFPGRTSRSSGIRAATVRSTLATAAVLPLLFALTACGSSSTASVARTNTDLGACGTVPVIAPNDPDGLLPAMPEAVQAAFNGFPYEVLPSAYKDLPAADKPVKVGVSAFPEMNTYNVDANAMFKEEFAKAKKAGLVEGELMFQLMADPATMTPAEQIRGYQELVRQGADVILLTPLSGEAMAPVVEEAGKKGVITITMTGHVLSEYSVNVAENFFAYVANPMAEAVKLLGGKGQLVLVPGQEGVSVTNTLLNAANSVVANCPDIKVVGQVVGGYNNSVAQSALVTYLASHPAQVDAVLQLGTMGAGVYSAFEQVGRPTPLVIDLGGSAASLAYWNKNLPNGYKGAGTVDTGPMSAKAGFNVAMRVIQGQGPKLNMVVPLPNVVTNDNVADFTVPGADTSSPVSAKPSDQWLSDPWIDQYFTAPAVPLP